MACCPCCWPPCCPCGIEVPPSAQHGVRQVACKETGGERAETQRRPRRQHRDGTQRRDTETKMGHRDEMGPAETGHRDETDTGQRHKDKHDRDAIQKPDTKTRH